MIRLIYLEKTILNFSLGNDHISQTSFDVLKKTCQDVGKKCVFDNIFNSACIKKYMLCSHLRLLFNWTDLDYGWNWDVTFTSGMQIVPKCKHATTENTPEESFFPQKYLLGDAPSLSFFCFFIKDLFIFLSSINISCGSQYINPLGIFY